MLSGANIRFTVGTKILLIILTITTLFVAVIVYQSNKTTEISRKETDNLVYRSAPLVFDIKELIIESKNQGYLTRGYLLTNDTSYLEQYAESQKKTNNLLVSLEEKLITPEGKQRMMEMRAVLRDYQQVTATTIQIYQQQGERHAVNYLMSAGDASLKVETTLDDFCVFLTERMDLRVRQSHEAVAAANRITMAAVAITVVLAISLSVVFSRRIAKALHEVVTRATAISQGNLVAKKISYHDKDEIYELVIAFEQMSADLRNLIGMVGQASEQVTASAVDLREGAAESAQAINQVAISVSEIAQGTGEQVTAIDATVTVIEQMSSNIHEVTARSNSVNDVVEQANQAAVNGRKSVTQAVNQIQNIETTVRHSADMVAKLGERSQEIGKIVDIIAGIAGQTNLLALNAAIEAARAGEQGRGFSVVADEVRKLAEQSQDAASQIANLISEVQQDTTEAVKAMDKGTNEVRVGTEAVQGAGLVFADIEGLINKVALEMHDIVAAIEHVASGSNQVVTSIRQIDKITKQASSQTQTVSAASEEQSASIQEFAASSHALAEVAGELQIAIRKFTI